MKKLLCLAAVMLLLLPHSALATEVATSAKACIVIDEVTGRVLLSHNAEEKLPMASTTKVMTALLALELGDLDAPVTCSGNAFGVPGTSIYLAKGETLALRHMLYGLMLASGNDAAVAIAEHIGSDVSSFCTMMTKRARELGCHSTVFLTPHGLPCDGHYTTAHDLALIAREAMQHPFFREMVSTSRATIPWESRSYDRVLTNKNRLLTTYEGATGIKTGYTRKAGRCLVFGAERDGMRIIGVVLNCADWFDEAARLMDLAFARYECATVGLAGDVLATLPVTLGEAGAADVVLADDLRGVIPKDGMPQMAVDLPQDLEAPVIAGQVVGMARMECGGVIVAEVPLISRSTIARDDFPARWHAYWQQWLMLP